MNILYIFLAFMCLWLMWFIITYNSFIYLRSFVQEAWSGIDVQLKRRYDLIPHLVEVVKGYSFHEKNIIDNIVSMRALSMRSTGPEGKEQAELELSGALKSLFALAENYPNLKANENFLALQKDLSAIEQDLQLARRYYNGTVRNYNNKILSFPAHLVASFMHLQPVSYFEIELQEKSAPSIKF
ncbi:LemA family protein [Candidatus Dependentiae bacterium]|nr:LemA family protein [Candidatus Dependentiae bacterium]